MNDEQKLRLDELRWENERNTKKLQLREKLENKIPISSFSFLSNIFSDNFEHDDWPHNNLKLHQKIEIEQSEIIDDILKKFININSNANSYVFFMNYNFGLVKMQNDILLEYWKDLIEIDADEIFCYNPTEKYFVCIEKTEDFITGKEIEGAKWIYEITFSNQSLKDKLQ
jgi:hypothetical protein